MSQSKKENLHKKIYYPDCRAYPSKDAVLADMKKRRDRLRQLVGYAEKELDTLKATPYNAANKFSQIKLNA